LEYAEKTLQYLWQLWNREVALQSIINERKSLLSYSDNKLTIKNVT
jgi:spore cortex formation protein SpoVR/YcgB (stage V sporulation)